jgi:hypothetical protein
LDLLATDVELDLAVENDESLVLAMMNMQRCLALRVGHIDQGELTAGLAPACKDHGQRTKPPARFPVSRVLDEGCEAI